MTELLDRAARGAPDPAARPGSGGRGGTGRAGRHGGGPARFGRFLRARPGLVAAIAIVLLVLTAAVVPGLLAPGDPAIGDTADRMLPPGPGHWFGTDHLGRDVWTRVVHGASLSLQATVIAVAVALIAGGLIGLVAGFAGGWVDEILMRVVDVLLAIPAILLSLALITALGFGTVKVAIAVGIASVASFARVMRAETLRVRRSLYVEAARAVGTRAHVTLLRHVLPNAAGPVAVLAVLEFGLAILAISALSFLGYGAPPPASEWGSLVADGRNYLAVAWWMCAMPGLVIAATVLSVNRISRALDGEWRRSA
ncbi:MULTISPECIES: ABC transporter permease [Pseudonocardia]|uniref:ABC transporter permease n=2 Tax=Pseudonocardia TaxID=1847 RepID=A0ABQ0RT37_9PSEU|nr:MULTISPECIES: ABC transporter permease [Pseudonocardia]OSY37828.1 putative D,D-dipeptide transport system permease protein DdpC [Pseudonocardia autotrophica]TDN72509.1 peptide/nickel transport system permease protein [Pseudonocardia autotrophica]BBG03218.1 ABC transporter permease [Pseudonocardia autotrophica]GEC23835.1 ABC transporter permease [Pseudonocardia saturnea]